MGILVFLAVAGLYTLADVELNPVAKNLMGVANTKVEMYGFALKMYMACNTVFIPDMKWQSCFQMVASFFLVYHYLRWLPHMQEVVNHIRVGVMCTVFWASLLFCVMSFHPGYAVHEDAGRLSQRQIITNVLWGTFVPMGLLGAAMSWYRTRYFMNTVVAKFR